MNSVPTNQTYQVMKEREQVRMKVSVLKDRNAEQIAKMNQLSRIKDILKKNEANAESHEVKLVEES